jgi:hypothetical protein
MSCHYFDPSAFSQPALATYGNTNRNEFRGPGFFNMNLSVLRDFNLKEKATLSVRADAFSLTNTPHFANPGATCPSGVGQLCNTDSSMGVITGTAQPGGFFGPDAGNRTMWLGATVRF